MFIIIQGFPIHYFTVSPILQNSAQVMFEAGLPVVLQNKIKIEPSVTVWLLLAVVVLGETPQKEN